LNFRAIFFFKMKRQFFWFETPRLKSGWAEAERNKNFLQRVSCLPAGRSWKKVRASEYNDTRILVRGEFWQHNFPACLAMSTK
jgi:hypothetical protein